MRISINQPYWCPYAGYLRLLATTDIFVIYDDVQFEKGGWVHRNKLQRMDGKIDWLHIPIQRPSLGTKIKELQWMDGSDEFWIKNSRRFKAFNEDANNFLRFYAYYLQQANKRMEYKHRTPLDFIVGCLDASNYELRIGKGTPVKADMIYSSTMGIPEALKGQDRVIWICKKLKAKEYINAPGGTSLYDKEVFNKHDIDLKFLCDYPNKQSILDRLMNEKPRRYKERDRCLLILSVIIVSP